MELIALSFPWILLLLVIVAIGLVFFKRWKLSVGLLLLLLVGNCYFQCLPVNLLDCFGDSSERLEDGAELRMMSFNCNLSSNVEEVQQRREDVIDIIRNIESDIVFLTENFIGREDSVWLGINDVYPYHSQKKNSVGNQLYSKFPILVDTTFQEKHARFGIIYCKIEVRDDVLDVIGVHLSSNNYNEDMEYLTPDSVENGRQVKSYLKNILAAEKHRQDEALRIAGVIDSLKRVNGIVPTIVIGDFNDVCGSPTLKLFESYGLSDAWWERGCGYGATIHNPLPYRIDHILYNNELKLKSVKKLDAKDLSDHDALVAEISL